MGVTAVVWRETGQIIVCSDDLAARWITAGLAAWPARVVETTSLTTVPTPARLHGVERR
jgi:hypothetical protein